MSEQQPAAARGGGRRGGGRGGGGRGGKGRGGGGGAKDSGSGGGANKPGNKQQQQGGGNAGNANNSGGNKGRNKGRGKGGRGGGGKKIDSNKNANKQQQAKQPPPPTNDEKKRLDEERSKKEQDARDESARKLEAKKREEEEKAAQEAAKARAKQQELEDEKVKDAIATLRTVLDTVQQHQTYRVAMELDALQQSRKSFESNKKNLKTDLKKCTTFCRKVKSGAAWSMKPDDIVKDVASLNLSRYVEEVVTAVMDAKPKVTDIPVIVALTTSMHERYNEFLPNLLQSLWNMVLTKADGADATKSRRVCLRLLTEFLLCGVISETKNLMKVVVEASGAKDDGNYVVQDAHIVVAFTKQAGPELFGVTPLSVTAAIAQIQNYHQRVSSAKAAGNGEITDQALPSAELVASGMEMVEKVQEALKVRAVDETVTEVAMTHCLGAFRSLSDSLVQSHLTLRKMEKRCEQDRLVLGSLTEAREKGLADARKLKESLLKCVENLSDVLAQPVPYLEEEKEELKEGPGIEVLTTGGDGENADFGPFDDEETHAFYCDIPDYLTTIPPALLGLTPEAIEAKKAENMLKYGDAAEGDLGDEADSMQDLPNDDATEGMLETDMDAGEGANEAGEGTEEEDKETPRYKLTVLLESELPESHGREQIDELSERFCSNHGSSKNARKRLAKTLFQVPHARLDLLPFYSRLTATVDRVWSDVAPPLVVDLEQQFHGQAKFKKNQNLESRMRTARYIGELTKFRVAAPIVFLRCMRRCLDDFTGSNVDIACCLMESCGRFLFKLKHTSAKINTLLETMTRLSKLKNLDERLQSLIKAAFFSVKPPQSGTRRLTKEYPPLESYLRHLLMVRLEPTDSVVSEVVKQLMRFPWNDPAAQCGVLVNRIMLKACRKGRYKTIEAVAAVVASLRRRGAVEICVRLVDSIVEELRWTLEHPNFRDQQRTLTYVRLLGELFARSQVSSKLVMDQLYEFINIGHEIPHALREASKKMLEEPEEGENGKEPVPQLPEYNSSGAVAKTIAEDEEMEDSELEQQQEQEPESPKPVAVSAHSIYDPRVPSDTDPPAAAFRIKLVCTLLELASRHLVTKANLSSLEGFLTALQRYLFTKPVLPTEVEFSLLDTFDAVDSQWRKATKATTSEGSEEGKGFKRYDSWLEAHNATVALEEAEALNSSKKRNDLEAIADNSKSIEDIMTRMIDQNLDEDSVSHMDDDEEEGSLAYSAKGSVQSPSHGEGEESETEHDDVDHTEQDEDDDEDMESDSEAESDDLGSNEDEFDEEAYARQLEEEAFERELRLLTMDALEKGKSTSKKVVASDMISGSQVVKKKPLEHLPAEEQQTKTPSFLPPKKAGVTVQLLRKGNKGKVEAKELVVPMETNLAIATTKKDEAAARERDEIKMRVLQYEADSAEAEMTGGNVYLEQEKLQVIRNKPLSMEEIDKNFGTKRGDLQADQKKQKSTGAPGKPSVPPNPPRASGRASVPPNPPRGGPGRGRGRGAGRNSSGRGLL